MVVRAFRQTDPPPEDPAFSQNLDLAYPLHRPAVLLASGGPSSSFTGRRPVLVASLCSSGGAPCTIPCLRPCRRGGCGYPSSVDGWLQVHGMAWTCVIQPMDTVNLQKEVQQGGGELPPAPAAYLPAARLPGGGGSSVMGRGGLKNRHGPERGRGRRDRGENEQGPGEARPGQGPGEARPGQGPGEGEARQGRGAEARQEVGSEKGKKQGHGKEKQGHGKVSRAKGDAASKATRTAKIRAVARLRAEAKRQEEFSDVPKYILHIFEDKLALKREIQRFIRERKRRFGFVRATYCHKVPVTSPNHSQKDDQSDEANVRPEEITYHVLVFESKYGNLEVLIREYDGYVIAIRPQPADPNQNHGWFLYADVTPLPAHLFGTENWKMVYNSGYLAHEYVEMGDGCFDQIVKILVRINKEDCMKRKPKRGWMLQTLNVFVGEAQRLSAILRFFICNISAYPWVPLGKLSFWTNHWAKLGKGIMRLVIASYLKRVMEGQAAEDKAKKQIDKAKKALEGFVGQDIPLTQNELLRQIPRGHRRIHRQCAAVNTAEGADQKGPLFGTDQAGNDLSLTLLLGYVILIKYNTKVVPKLIHWKKQVKDKENSKDKEKGAEDKEAKDKEKGAEDKGESEDKEKELIQTAAVDSLYGVYSEHVAAMETSPLAPTVAAPRALQMGTKVHVSNLNASFTVEDAQELFSEIGELKSYSVNCDKDGKSQGSAEFVFARKVDALDAIERYNGLQFDGKPMKIEIIGNKTEPCPTAPLMHNHASSNYNAVPNSLPQGGDPGARGEGGGGQRGMSQGSSFPG